MKTLAIALIAAALALPAAAQTFEAGNGAKFRITDIRRIGDGRTVVTMIDEDNHGARVVFDCSGRYGMLDDGVGGTWHSVPSRSLLAHISRIVCKQ